MQGEQNLSPATISYYFVAIRFFYKMNDVMTINWEKISKVLPEFRKVANDRPYSVSEISILLEKVDHRGRIIILLMASSGMREGAIHSLKLSDIERIQDIYKITVYKNDPAEYYAFCSPECAKAIDDYLEYRKRCGEVLNPSAPILRQRFNKLDAVDSANPKGVSENNATSNVAAILLCRSNSRSYERNYLGFFSWTGSDILEHPKLQPFYHFLWQI
jgi:integrase